jgi:hypothetical protein
MWVLLQCRSSNDRGRGSVIGGACDRRCRYSSIWLCCWRCWLRKLVRRKGRGGGVLLLGDDQMVQRDPRPFCWAVVDGRLPVD